MTVAGRNLVLVGMPGSGKSTVGLAVAERLGREFVDTDELVAAAAGRDVPEIFRAEGEAGFRARERQAVAAVAARRNLVVATGGGVLGDPENLARLRGSGVLVALWAAPEALVRRAAEGRPLLEAADPLARVKELLAAREAQYRQADLHLDTTGLSVDEAARTLVDLVSAEQVSVPGYDVWVGAGLSRAVGPSLAALGGGRRALVVADAGVAGTHAATVVESLRRSGFEAAQAVVPAGEESKSLAQAERLYGAALDAGLDRRGWIVAVGGGVAGDLAGFVAATFLRGVAFVPVPTTLLAQVDASVGGKVAVNLARGKNLVGAFHRPRAVFADVAALATLPDGELRSGLAEVVKHGILGDADYYLRVRASARELAARDPRALAEVVAGSVRIKAAVVAEDEREESGARMALNLGHTLAHAVEAVAGYGAWRHGEAVAVGLCAAGRLALRRGLWDAAEEADVEDLLGRLGLPTRLGGLPADLLLAAMRYDKKARGGRLRWVLPERLGRVAVRDDVAEAEVLSVLRELGAG
jgi:shikimate kinase/3-dehydroquinate synthase